MINQDHMVLADFFVNSSGGPDAVVKSAWKVEDCGFEPNPGLQVSQKQNVSSPLTREDSILREASVTER